MPNLLRFYLLVIGLSLYSTIVKAQEIQFQCDSNFSFSNILWSEQSTRDIYDSLNTIDFSKQDFELRIWQTTFGQVGMVSDVFVLRHFKGRKGWQGYFYSGFKDGRTHKNMKEYFSNNHLKVYSKKEWKIALDSLMSYNILEIEPPTQEDLLERYGFITDISHDTHFSIELLKEDCKRSYGFSYGTARSGPFDEIPEFIALRRIVELRQRYLKQNLAYSH